jgi:hypothetical protein
MIQPDDQTATSSTGCYAASNTRAAGAAIDGRSNTGSVPHKVHRRHRVRHRIMQQETAPISRAVPLGMPLAAAPSAPDCQCHITRFTGLIRESRLPARCSLSTRPWLRLGLRNTGERVRTGAVIVADGMC